MPTNVPLQSIKLASPATTFVFSDIDQSYSDLRVVVSGFTSGNSVDIQGKINGDTGSNYSRTTLEAAGANPTGVAGSNQTYARFGWCPAGTTYQTETLDFLNYSDKSNFKMVLQRASVNTWSYMAAINWRSTAAITTLEFTPGSGTFNAGTTFSLYGIRSGASSKASGGDTVTTDGTYWYHTFLRTSAFTPIANLTCDYLVIAGGGGGSGDYGGGGGGGGYRTTVGTSGGGGSAESQLSLLAGVTYPVLIGAGGTANGGSVDAGTANKGSDTTFHTITSTGGGYGGGFSFGSRNQPGGIGGSGGGGGAGESADPTGSGGSGTTNQGYAGSAGSKNSSYRVGGSGGGAGGAGGTSVGSTGATTGGVGLTSSISGSAVGRAGGGGGASQGGGGAMTATDGGGAGAKVGNTIGTSGTAGTGGGGGGGPTTGGAGGSGVVIVRYAV